MCPAAQYELPIRMNVKHSQHAFVQQPVIGNPGVCCACVTGIEAELFP